MSETAAPQGVDGRLKVIGERLAELSDDLAHDPIPPGWLPVVSAEVDALLAEAETLQALSPARRVERVRRFLEMQEHRERQARYGDG